MRKIGKQKKRVDSRQALFNRYPEVKCEADDLRQHLTSPRTHREEKMKVNEGGTNASGIQSIS